MLKHRDLHECTELYELLSHPSVFPFVRQKATSADEYWFMTKQLIEEEARGLAMLLVPLSAQKSRVDQILNANLFKKQGYAEVLQEDELTKESFMKSVHTLTERKVEMVETMAKTQKPKTPDEMASLILRYKK